MILVTLNNIFEISIQVSFYVIKFLNDTLHLIILEPQDCLLKPYISLDHIFVHAACLLMQQYLLIPHISLHEISAEALSNGAIPKLNFLLSGRISVVMSTFSVFGLSYRRSDNEFCAEEGQNPIFDPLPHNEKLNL